MNIATLGKYGRFAPPHGATSGYIFSGEEQGVIVDFGSGCMSKFLELSNIDSIQAIVLSHLHFDHISDIFTFAYYLMSIGRKIDLYAPKSPSKVFELLENFSVFKLHVIETNKLIKIGGISIFPIEVNHPVQTFSLIISDDKSKIMYTSDLTDIAPLKNYLNEMNCIIGDACILESKHCESSPHLSVKSLAEALPSHVKLYLAHLSYGEEFDILEEAKLYHDNTEIMLDKVVL